ncbi:MAG: hypothetical protein JKP95_04045 [Oceanicaulis sp.]|nr:hypothetical protein [Oceanicaulis sp.]
MTGRWLSVLDLKLWRDVWSMRGQALAIALVIAGGVSVHLVMAGMGSLDETRSAYYERYRFADIWRPRCGRPMRCWTIFAGSTGWRPPSRASCPRSCSTFQTWPNRPAA